MRMTIRTTGVLVLVLGTVAGAVTNNLRLMIISAGVGLAFYLVGRSE
jgi:type IV secretory pathway TrbD component